MWFDCDLVTPLGVSVIRQFNSSECIVSKKVYLFGYGGVRYGIDEGISTMQDFLDYRDMHCIPYLVYDGCFITVDDKRICYGGGYLVTKI